MDEQKTLREIIDEIIDLANEGPGVLQRCNIEDKFKEAGIDFASQERYVFEYLENKGVEIIETNECYETEPTDEELRGYEEEYSETDEIDNLLTIPSGIEKETVDSIKQYLEEIRKYELLSHMELVELSEQIKLGDKKAKEKMINHNLRLVVSRAKKYNSIFLGITFLDLIQEGNEGLIKAVEKYDSSKGNKFSTYAVWWIDQMIKKAISQKSGVIRIPIHMVNKIYKYNRVFQNLAKSLGHDPNDSEIADEMGVKLEEIKKIQNAKHMIPQSLEEPVGESIVIGDTIVASGNLEETATNKELVRSLSANKFGFNVDEKRIFEIKMDFEEKDEKYTNQMILDIINMEKKEKGEKEVNINKIRSLRNSVEKKVREHGIHLGVIEESSLTLEEYNICFHIKYSFYSLMRRIYHWFTMNLNKSEDIQRGFMEFKKYVSGNGKKGYEYKYQPMFFSEKFILDNFYNKGKNGLSEKMATQRGIYDEYLAEQKKLVERAGGESNLMKLCDSEERTQYNSPNFDAIFIDLSPGRANVVKHYYDIIRNTDKFKEERERIIELVKLWFPTEEIRNSIITDVIENQFYARRIVPTDSSIGQKSIKMFACDYLYIDDDYFRSIAAMFDEQFKYDVKCGFEYGHLLQIVENQDEGMTTKKDLLNKEKVLQNVFDQLSCQGKYLIVNYGKDNISKKDNPIQISKKDQVREQAREYNAADMLKKHFEYAKEDTCKYIANVIMTSLCANIRDALKYIWNINEINMDEIGIEGDSLRNYILKATFPLAANCVQIDSLRKLKTFRTHFYKEDLSFLNILVYDNWNDLHDEFKEIESPYSLLVSCYEYLCTLSDDELVNYLMDYQVYYIKNHLSRCLVELATRIIEDEKEEQYDILKDIVVNKMWGIVSESVRMVFEARLMMLDILPYDDNMYQYLCETYFETRNEAVVKMIIEYLNSMSDESVQIDGESIQALLKKWQQISLLNGDVSKINKIFREVSLDKLSERMEKVKKTSKLRFGESNIRTKNIDNLETNAIPEDCGEIFIVLGAGRAAMTFVNSVLGRKNSKIFIVLQQDELKQAEALKKWYHCSDENIIPVLEEDDLNELEVSNSKIAIVDGGLQEIYKYLELYNLDILCTEKENENAFSDYVNRTKKIHFLALGDEKHENLKNVADFIKTTWEHYVLYDFMVKYCSRIDVKIDFKEVDIVVDAYSFETAYIDSIFNRLDKDFYLKIDYIEYKREITKELLTEYPLFLVDMQEAKLNTVLQAPPTFSEDFREEERFFEAGKTKHNVVILGCNEQKDVILEMIKGILRVSGYLPIPDGFNEYLPERAKEIEQLIGSNFSLTIIAKDTSEMEDALQFDAPDLFVDTGNGRTYLHDLKPNFVNLDPESYRFIRCLADLSQKHGLEKEDKKISKTLRDANYFICMLNDDAASYRMAIRIREEGYRMDETMKHVPVIAALCEHGFIDTDMNTFRVINDDSKEMVYKDPWWRSYDICCFGSFDRCFSYENLYTNYISEISRSVHVKFGDEDTKVRAYYKNYYNHKASDQRAVTIPYAFYSVLYKEMCKDCTLSDAETELAHNHNVWSVRIFRDNIEKYVEKYNAAIRQGDKGLHTGKILWLAVLEKNRFNVNLTLEGYTSAVQGTENRAVFARYMQGWQRRSVDGALKDKLHIAKLHGDITTWDYSKGQDYDSVYANEMGDYLLLELEREKSRMHQQSFGSKIAGSKFVKNVKVSGIKAKGVAFVKSTKLKGNKAKGITSAQNTNASGNKANGVTSTQNMNVTGNDSRGDGGKGL